jgi:hypothetical protein
VGDDAATTQPDTSAEPFIDRNVPFERTWLDDSSWVDVARGWIKQQPASWMRWR